MFSRSTTATSNERTASRWIFALWMLVITFGVSVIAPITHASHPYGLEFDDRHLSSIHLDTPRTNGGKEDELYCTEVMPAVPGSGLPNPNVTEEALRIAVQTALTRGWNTINPTNNPRIQFALISTTKCSELSVDDRARLRVRFLVFYDPRKPGHGFLSCGDVDSRNINCVTRGDPEVDPRFSPNHRHTRLQNVQLTELMFTTYSEATRIQILNHEIGHTLGLMDPTLHGTDGCDDRYLPSVMHILAYLGHPDYGNCPGKAYTGTGPAPKDLDRVRWMQQSLNFQPYVPVRR